MRKVLTVLAVAGIMVGRTMAADTWLVDVSALDPWLGTPAEVAVLRVGIPYGSNPTISGLDVGFWGRSERAWGVQLNLILNNATEKMGGVQIAGCNLAEDATGLQVGLWNSATTLAGVQLGGINELENGQFLQCGLGNYADTLKGVQLGIWNNAPGITGLQLGLFNMSQAVEGYQIGLFNKTDRMRGFQLGLVNTITASSLPVSPVFNCVF
jgi:hypothetical protein